jgi:hypothetical protein
MRYSITRITNWLAVTRCVWGVDGDVTDRSEGGPRRVAIVVRRAPRRTVPAVYNHIISSRKGFAFVPPPILDVVDNFWTLKGKLSQNPTIWPLKGKLSQNPVIQILACLKNIF